MFASLRFIGLLLGVCQLWSLTDAGKLPSFIKPCNLNDKNMAECMLNEARRIIKQFAGGIPELGVESMDPLMVGDIDMAAFGDGGLKFTQHNTVVTGLKNTKLLDLYFDYDNKTGGSHIFGDLTSKSNYTIEGRLLLFPINGQGECVTKMKGFDLKSDWDWELYNGNDGKQHIRIMKQRTKVVYGKTNIKMTGLFNDDKFLGETMNNFLNANSNDVMRELGMPAVKAVEARTKKIINKFFAEIPAEDLFPSTPIE